MKRWFDKSISFACTACGKCCASGGSTKVFVNRKEIQNIAFSLNLQEELFVANYVDERVDDRGRILQSLKKHSTKSQCVFLNGKKCSIYGDRPTQCRTYPFWPHVMIGDAEWKGEAQLCEGIQVDTSLKTSDSTRVDPDVVALNMIIHQIHDRGLGENWTYDEAVELLKDSKEEYPSLYDDYLAGFFEDTESHTVYEDEVLRVVDSKAPLPDGEEGHSYSRRMEFVSTPALAQTEMVIDCTDDEWIDWAANTDNREAPSHVPVSTRLDYFILHMPVHRVIGGICTDFLEYLSKCRTEQEQRRVAVIGAGCCALPAYLLARNSRSTLTIHAVEPSTHVLDAAERFFGINFDGRRLLKYAETGSQYLIRSAEAFHDIIIVDAFADRAPEPHSTISSGGGCGDDDESSDYEDGADVRCEAVQCAPPEELLQDLPLLARALTSPATETTTARAGLLVINVYGPPDWVELVTRRIESTGLFCPVLSFPTTAAQVHAQQDTAAPLSIADNRNVVLVTMPIAGADILGDIGKNVDVLSTLNSHQL